MPLPAPRQGTELILKGRALEFSYWPVARTTRRYGLASRFYATDPWMMIRRSVANRLPVRDRRAASALVEQAEDFYRASKSGASAAKPLLLYYCFMNLVKAYLLVSGRRPTVDNAQHGISERSRVWPLIGATIEAHHTPASGIALTGRRRIQIFDEFHLAITGRNLPLTRYRLTTLLPQVVPGHRLWAIGAGPTTPERFLAVAKIEFVQSTAANQMWLRLYFYADDLKRLAMTHRMLMSCTGLDQNFHEVAIGPVGWTSRDLVCFEQRTPLVYAQRSADRIQDLVATLRHKLWPTVLNVSPYRKYYVYACPANERRQELPQLLSIYAIAFYLGSITRYRPHHFDKIWNGKYGPFIETFLLDQPSQFIYLMASEFSQRDLAKAELA
jgi:hypothetical protein